MIIIRFCFIKSRNLPYYADYWQKKDNEDIEGFVGQKLAQCGSCISSGHRICRNLAIHQTMHPGPIKN
jgi:hypothetical protein